MAVDKPPPNHGRSRFIAYVIYGLVSMVILGGAITFYFYHKQSMAARLAESQENIDFLQDYLSTTKDSFKSQHHLSPRTGFKISSANVEEEFSSYLLKKQEYKISTYVLALSNAVKILHLPYTPTHLDAIRDCNKYMKPSLFYNQHALELRFPFMLSQMSLLNEKYRGKRGTSYFDIQYLENRTISLNPLIRHEYVFDEPLFYYMQSFVYYTVYCSYKPRGKENWAKGGRYQHEIADYIVTTSEWQENQGINFISPASHPKSGPSVVHPANINAFSRQTFLRTDFDFSGHTPKDVIVPYFVEYTYSRQMYANSSVRHPHDGFSPDQLVKGLARHGSHNSTSLRGGRREARKRGWEEEE